MTKQMGLRAIIVPFLLAAAPSWAALPIISKVAFKKAGTTFSVTITGNQFGTAPSGVPCTNCAIAEFSLVEAAQLVTPVSYNITSWTNTSITLTDAAVSVGDTVFVAAKNDTLKNIASWAGNVPGKVTTQYNYPWGPGWNGQGLTDTVTFNYKSWTNTQIVIGGFGGAYGTDGFIATKGDPYVFLLWQTPGIVAGSTGPQTGKGGRVQ